MTGNKETRSARLKYAVMLICVFLAFSIRFCLAPWLGEDLPYMFFIAAVLVAAWYGGAAQGFFALVLGVVLASFSFIPRKAGSNPLELVEILRSLRYVLTSTIGIVVIELLHRARRRTQAAVEELEQEVKRREKTEQALLEAQLQLSKHARQLEGCVAERTAMLQATIRSLEDLLYHIAHNLRAPLRALEGFSTLLLKECRSSVDPTSIEYAKRIAGAAKNMDALIYDLLEYGHLTQAELELHSLDLERAVQEVLGKFSTKNVEMKVLHPLPPIRGNSNALQVVLFELLDNAVKFVAPGTVPRIEISAEQCADTVRLNIQDNGIGIRPEYQERIFGVFERLKPGNASEGTGIGLAMVKLAMQRMDGLVGLESHPGQGSRFWLEFQKPEEA